ncbi:hypothetical protein C8R45DRAFT_1213426 [Mycena sanguinolenta]|nr:hypothetical protein C8R45DRAFT_1213426 [Mycena sanguinolenta]
METPRLSRFHHLLPLPSLAIFIPLTLLTIARGMSWVSLWILMAIWATGAAGLSINMTSAHTLPTGGTTVFGPEENVVDEQLVNAGVQLSGTVTMVVPRNTPTGVYQTLAYTGTDGPTLGTGPALWGDEIELIAASSASGLSQSSTGSFSSIASQPSDTASQTSNAEPQTSTSVSGSVFFTPISRNISSSYSSPSPPLSQFSSSTASGVIGGASNTTSPFPGRLFPRHVVLPQEP